MTSEFGRDHDDDLHAAKGGEADRVECEQVESMSRQYSAKTFLRKVPNKLLRDYFAAVAIDLELNWDGLVDTDVEPIFEAIHALNDKQRGAVESDFTNINELACENGTRAILEEAAFWGKDWSAQFAQMENAYERAFWTFLN